MRNKCSREPGSQAGLSDRALGPGSQTGLVHNHPEQARTGFTPCFHMTYALTFLEKQDFPVHNRCNQPGTGCTRIKKSPRVKKRVPGSPSGTGMAAAQQDVPASPAGNPQLLQFQNAIREKSESSRRKKSRGHPRLYPGFFIVRIPFSSRPVSSRWRPFS